MTIGAGGDNQVEAGAAPDLAEVPERKAAFEYLRAFAVVLVPCHKRSTVILGNPVAFFGALLGISIVASPPVAIIFRPLQWIGNGPFHAQVGRILLYLVCFLAGTAIGAYGIDRSAFRSNQLYFYGKQIF